MKRVLITGAKGMLGQELIRQLKNQHLEIFAFGRELNVADQNKVRQKIAVIRPDTVFHFAAKTDVDWCERYKEECFETNVLGAENLAKECYAAGAKLIFPSTYYVYSGLTKFPIDDRRHKPKMSEVMGIYSQSKLLAEEVVWKKTRGKAYTVRLGSLFGGGQLDKKFVGKIFSLVKSKKTISVVADQFIQPSYSKDTVRNMLLLLTKGPPGNYNMVGHGVASFYEYAREVLYYGQVRGVTVVPINSKRFRQAAPRASKLEAINGKLSDLGIDRMRDWKIALAEYIKEEW